MRRIGTETGGAACRWVYILVVRTHTHLDDVFVFELLQQLDLSQSSEVCPLRVLAELHRNLLDRHHPPRRLLSLRHGAQTMTHFRTRRPVVRPCRTSFIVLYPETGQLTCIVLSRCQMCKYE